jgi:hypothetical protein
VVPNSFDLLDELGRLDPRRACLGSWVAKWVVTFASLLNVRRVASKRPSPCMGLAKPSVSGLAWDGRPLSYWHVVRGSVATWILPLRAIAILTALIVTACASQTGDDPFLWGRLDCQRTSGNPALIAESEKSRTTCEARAKAASAFSAYANLNDTPAMKACMLDAGYQLQRRSEFEANCKK